MNHQSLEFQLNDAYKQQYESYLATLSEAEREKLMARTTKKRPNGPQVKEAIEGGTITQGIQPNTALYFFQLEKLTKYETRNPALSKAELIKLIASEFESLSSKKRGKYEKMALAATTKVKTSYVFTCFRLITRSFSVGNCNSRFLPISSKSKKVLFKNEPRKPPM